VSIWLWIFGPQLALLSMRNPPSIPPRQTTDMNSISDRDRSAPRDGCRMLPGGRGVLGLNHEDSVAQWSWDWPVPTKASEAATL